MTKKEKINYIQEHHFSEWLKTRKETENELSDRQSMYCVCRRLATGLHESMCSQFRKRVDEDTIIKLEHLLSK